MAGGLWGVSSPSSCPKQDGTGYTLGCWGLCQAVCSKPLGTGILQPFWATCPTLCCVCWSVSTPILHFHLSSLKKITITSCWLQGFQNNNGMGVCVSFSFVETVAQLFSRLFFFLISFYSFGFSCIIFASPNFSCSLLLISPLVVLCIFTPSKYNTYSSSFFYNTSNCLKAYLPFPYIFLYLNSIQPISALLLSSQLNCSKLFIWCERRTIV